VPDNPKIRDKTGSLVKPGNITRRGLFERAGQLGAAGSLTFLMPKALRARESGGPVVMGVMGPMTGDTSSSGRAILNGAMMALNDARAEGEVPLTVNGQEREVEIVQVDSQSNPEKAVEALTEAVTRQGVDFMLAGWHSSVAMASLDAEAPLNIVHIGHMGESQYVSEKINEDPDLYRGWFKGWPAPPIFAGLYGEPLNHFMEQGLWTPANREAAVLVEDTDFGRGWGDALSASLNTAGFEVESYDVAAFDETEFTPLITRYKEQGVAVVGMTMTGSLSASSFVKQFRSLDLPALLLAHGLTWFSEWYDSTGDASDFAVTMDSPRAIEPYQTEWIERYAAKYDEEPSLAPAGTAYDYMRLSLSVINSAGTLDFNKLVASAENTEHKGVWHYYKFSKEPGPNALAPHEIMTGGYMQGFFFPMVQLRKGEPKIIWPLEYAQEKFEQPPWV